MSKILCFLLLLCSSTEAMAFEADATSFAWDPSTTDTAWGAAAWSPSSVSPYPYTLLFHGAAPSSCGVTECNGLSCFSALTDSGHGQRLSPRCPGESGGGLSWALLDDLDGLELHTYNGPLSWFAPNAGIVATYASLVVDEVATVLPFAGATGVFAVEVTAAVTDDFTGAHYRQAQQKVNWVFRNPNTTPGQIELAGRLFCSGINCSDATVYDASDPTQGGIPWVDGTFAPSACTELTTPYLTSELWCSAAGTDTQSVDFGDRAFSYEIYWDGFLRTLRAMTFANGLDGDDDDDVNALFGTDATLAITWRVHEVRLAQEVYSSLASKEAHVDGAFRSVYAAAR